MFDWFFKGALLLMASSWAGIALFRWYALSKGIMDKPNERSLHLVSTPRGGGLIFSMLWFTFLGALIYFSDLNNRWEWWVYLIVSAPALIVVAVGFLDDLRGLSIRTRLIGQCLAAALSLWVILDLADVSLTSYSITSWVLCVTLLLGIIWSINLVNFMDGCDGLATLQSMVVSIVGGYFIFDSGGYQLGLLSWGLSCLLLGFLIWNLPTARIFMGDSGSGFLGFWVALLALMGYYWFNLPLQYWVILMGPFWFDATITLIRRFFRGEALGQAHREHAYQRLIQSGWSHQSVLLGLFILNGLLSGLAIWAYREPKLLNLALVLTLLLLVIVYGLVESVRPMYKNWHDRT